MKKIMAIILALALVLSLNVFSFVSNAEVTKYIYNDFNSGLSTEPSATGNGNNTAYVFGVDGATYSCADGVLNVKMTQNQYVRIQNSLTGHEDYKYMVVRMKGTHDWGVMSSSPVAFWFGSYGTPGARLYVPAEQFTADFTDVVLEIPEGYFDSIGDGYKSCLFITTERGANIDLYIDEIYFCNDEEPEAPEVPEVPEEPELTPVYYNDFNSGLSTTPTATGNGNNTSYVVNVEDANADNTISYTCTDGALHLELSHSDYIRLANTMVDFVDYNYMFIRMKGTYDWDVLTGNTIYLWFGSYSAATEKIYIPVEKLTEDYSDILIKLPDDYFYGANGYGLFDDYMGNLFIGTERGAKFSIDIDAIGFYKVAPYYSDFESGLSTEASATGYLDNTASVVSSEGLTYSCENGALHLEMTNGNNIRIQNTMTDITDYEYMVVKMKGSHNYGELTGNSIAFWFGSWSTPGARLYVPVEKLTADYSEVEIRIPAGYFDNIAVDYRNNLFITTERGATFTIDIDEISFRNHKRSDYAEGDMNLDGEVDIVDMVRLKKVIARTGKRTVACDINDDYYLNAADAVALRQILIGA